MLKSSPQSALDEATDPWGVKVERVEVASLISSVIRHHFLLSLKPDAGPLLLLLLLLPQNFEEPQLL